RSTHAEPRAHLADQAAQGTGRMAFLLEQLEQPVLREGGMVAPDRGRLIALHRVVNQMRATVGTAEIDPVVDLLPGGVVHRRAIAIVGEHHHAGEPTLLHQAVEVLAQRSLPWVWNGGPGARRSASPRPKTSG